MQRLDRRKMRRLLIREFRSVLRTLCEETEAELQARLDKEKRTRAESRSAYAQEYEKYRSRGSRGYNPAVKDEPGTKGRTSHCEDSPRQRYDELMTVFKVGAGEISIDRLGRAIHYLHVLRDKGGSQGFSEQQMNAEYEKIQRHITSLRSWEEDRKRTIAKIRRARLKARDLDDALWPSADCTPEVYVLQGDEGYEYSRASGSWHQRDRDSDNEWTAITSDAAIQKLESSARPKG